MEKKVIMIKLQDIFKDVLDNEDLVLENDTTPDDVEEWDSLANIQIIVAIQKGFSIKVSAKDAMNWKKIDDIIETIASKL